MNTVAFIFAIMAGVFTTIETSINSRLGNHLTPSIATIHSLATGLIFMLMISLVKGSLVRYSKVIYVSPIWLIGGIFGAFIIYFSAKSIPVLGISRALTLILAGQLISGLIIDLFINNNNFCFDKLLGLCLFLVGSYLIIK